MNTSTNTSTCAVRTIAEMTQNEVAATIAEIIKSELARFTFDKAGLAKTKRLLVEVTKRFGQCVTEDMTLEQFVRGLKVQIRMATTVFHSMNEEGLLK